LRVSDTDPTRISAALPMRTMAGLANTGTGVISSGVMNLNPVSIVFDNPPTTFTVSDTSTTPATQLATAVAYTSGSNISYNGWTVQIAGAAPVAGDTFNLVKSPSAVAMQATAASSNTGNASISGGVLNLQQPFAITFTSPTTYTVAGAVPAVVGAQAYTSGQDISYNGWTVQITGSPVAGDVFNVEKNTNASGDNRNALLMANLQLQNLLINGTASLQGAYGQLIGEIGAKTHELDITSQAQDSMTAQIVAAQQAISGVNLDEEAANLMRYQKLYQAAAKAMQIANSLFDEILSIGR
jgi:flagellar hook-associated protein 1 FlgK